MDMVDLEIGNFSNDVCQLQIMFSQKGSKSLPKFTSKNLKNIQLEDRCQVGVIYDIPRVLWVSLDPVDVRNDSQQDIHLQVVCLSNFLM